MILDYKDITIFYTDEGTGKSIVLLHGFLEDASMWRGIVSKLKKTHRLVTIDLLGHGKTGCLGNEHTMLDMAEAVGAVLKHLKIETVIIVGHSMGGYVSLAYAESNPEKIIGLCLLNSTYEADDEDRKLLRTRANKMVANNFKNMVRLSFANLFSESSKVKYKREFEAALQIALNTPVQGYIAANEGMKNRKDQSLLFKNASFKKAIMLGKKDILIDYNSMVNFAKSNTITVNLFSEGHMSHIENKTECLNALVHFIEKI